MRNSSSKDSVDILCSPVSETLKKLNSSEAGLSSEEIVKRRGIYGSNELAKKKKRSPLIHFFSHFKNPLLIILLVAATLSFVLGEIIDSVIIITMVFISALLDFFQEFRAEKAAEKLKKRVTASIIVIRNNARQEIKVSELVPGDIICLSAGDIVPADARVISSKDFNIDQSALTGESFPAEKIPDPIKPEEASSILNWHNYLFMGTSVLSGIATAVVVKTGSSTQYGEIATKITGARPETEFEKGLTKFGFLIMKVTFFLVIFVFFINALFKHKVLDSLLFAVALAVGLTPEFLPMILSINLSKGAMAMSNKGVIVKRLNSIQNFGSMDVLCSDKTGTLTENKVTVVLHIDLEGKENEKIFLHSFLNSHYQSGIKSALDDAILKHENIDISKYQKIDEIPFDFIRKRISIISQIGKEKIFITKGAPEEIVKICSKYELRGKLFSMGKAVEKRIEEQHNQLNLQGYRALGISYKKVKSDKKRFTSNDETEMIFLGFIAFIDPPKKTVKEAIELLKKSGIELKILTGDNQIVTKKICEEIGFEIKGIVLGEEIEKLNDDALLQVVEKANIFARVTPAQKNRIILALKNNKHVVGYIGDGINDTPSMRTSDVAISVENAVDIAKESADIILLKHDLKVLEEGVIEGRKTFGNTMKYIMMGVSSNFGNMLSAAGASLFLPFLPMLPMQILLNNFIYDLSNLTIPTDNVDAEYIEKPKKLDIKFIRKFMLIFGPLSSIFDFLTFFVMLYIFKANEPLFQAAWFVESLCTQILIIFVIRTRKVPFYKSKPSKLLIINVLILVAVGIIIPFSPLAHYFKFSKLPLLFLFIVFIFVVTYLAIVEFVKSWFYKKYSQAA